MSKNRFRHQDRHYETYEDYCANELASQYLHVGNVTVAFGGRKTIGGVVTDEPCVVIGVRRKFRKHEVPSGFMLPEKVGEVRTDVIEFPPLYSSSTCTGESGEACFPHDQKYRPVIGGISAINEGSTRDAAFSGVRQRAHGFSREVNGVSIMKIFRV